MTKICPQCKKEKTPEEFGFRTGSRKSQLKGLCRECMKQRGRQWTCKNRVKAKEQRNAASARWNAKRAADPEAVAAHADYMRRYNATKKYGLTDEEYEWCEQHRYTDDCEVCGKNAKDCPHGLLDIDHVHSVPPKFRGLLCMPCNTALGCTEDSIERLEKLIAYLKAKKVM